MGKKERKNIIDKSLNIGVKDTKPIILATGSLIGEGFDLPPLDTLFLTMPISFKGKLIQYAGRIHREFPEKDQAIVYDYLDSSLGLTMSMFKKRLTGYRKMQYTIEADTYSWFRQI